MLSLLICLSLPIRSREIIISSTCWYINYVEIARENARKNLSPCPAEILNSRKMQVQYSQKVESECLCRNHCVTTAHGENSIVTSYPEIKWRQLMRSREICEERV